MSVKEESSKKGFIVLPENLTKYIKKSNKKVGIIRAQKIQLLDTGQNVIFVVHTKAHSGMDKFNMSMMLNILENRYKYMFDIINNRKEIRIKDIKSYPSSLERLYTYMFNRADRYFKNYSVYKYTDMFNYIDYEEESAL